MSNTATYLATNLDSILDRIASLQHHSLSDTCDSRVVVCGYAPGLEAQVMAAWNRLTRSERELLDYTLQGSVGELHLTLENGHMDGAELSDLCDSIEFVTEGRLWWEAGDLWTKGECDICDEREDTPSEAAAGFLSDYPLEVVETVGRPLSVVLAVGGPYVEVSYDLGEGSPVLVGHWGGERVVRRDEEPLTWFMGHYLPEYI